jgi:membrane dipeptidase
VKPLKAAAIIGAAAVIIGVAVAVPRLVESHYDRVQHRPPYTASLAARELHRDLFIADLHADSLLWGRNLLTRSNRGHVDVPRLLEANVGLQVFTVVTKVPRGLNLNHNDDSTDMVTALAIAEGWPPSTWTSLKSRALYQGTRLKHMADDSEGELVFITTSAELDKFIENRKQKNGMVACVLGLEGAHALGGNVDNVDDFFAAGFRVVGLTHFFDNEMAGSSTGVKKYGLTAKGRELVHRLEAHHMLVDLAHASGATIDDVTAIATRSVIVSHTGVQGTCDNARNLSDERIREVAKTGGVVGIGYWSTAVCGTDATAIAKAIRYTVKVAGVEHIALGSDFDGSTTMPFDATGIVQITDALMKEGFTEREIRMIMGENSLRVLRQSLP